jgi:hypothetical protein
MICEPRVYAGKIARLRLLRAAYSELIETLELLETWGSQGALDELEDKLDVAAGPSVTE